VYEEVEGVVMDTRPGVSAEAYDNEQTLPEIEAKDINHLQDESPVSTLVDSDDTPPTLSSPSTSSASYGSVTSPPQVHDAAPPSIVSSEDSFEQAHIQRHAPDELLHMMTPELPELPGSQDYEEADAAAAAPPPVVRRFKDGDEPVDHLLHETGPAAADQQVFPPTSGQHMAHDRASHNDVPRKKASLLHIPTKAAHRLHQKVKKTVSFASADDVRTLTPSPNASMHTIRPSEVGVNA
jgi:hypothetical protein